MMRTASNRLGGVLSPWVLLSAGLLLLGGCASVPESPEQAVRTANPQDSAALHLELIQGLMSRGQYFAALAHLDAAEQSASSRDQREALALLRADCQRKTDQAALAIRGYQALLESRDSARAAKAAHGLGLVMAERNPRQSIRYLQMAADKQPTDPNIRNDLGFALMQHGEFAAARLALSTAYQLAPGDPRPRNNLIVLMLAIGKIAEAQRLERSAGLDPQTRQRLRQQAARVRAKQQP